MHIPLSSLFSISPLSMLRFSSLTTFSSFPPLPSSPHPAFLPSLLPLALTFPPPLSAFSSPCPPSSSRVFSPPPPSQPVPFPPALTRLFTFLSPSCTHLLSSFAFLYLFTSLSSLGLSPPLLSSLLLLTLPLPSSERLALLPAVPDALPRWERPQLARRPAGGPGVAAEEEFSQALHFYR